MDSSRPRIGARNLLLMAANVLLGAAGLALLALAAVLAVSSGLVAGATWAAYALACVAAAVAAYRSMSGGPSVAPKVSNETNAEAAAWARAHYPDAFAPGYTAAMQREDFAVLERTARRGPVAVVSLAWLGSAVLAVAAMAVGSLLRGEPATAVMLVGFAIAYAAGIVVVVKAMSRAMVQVTQANARLRVQLGDEFSPQMRARIDAAAK